MLLDRTISQLDIGPVPPDAAAELAHLGYMQWLAALPGDGHYPRAAMEAHAAAAPLSGRSPAVAVFCGLLLASVQIPPVPLALDLPVPQRRGGAVARRSGRTTP
jgi:hypothetical protein